MSALLDVDGGLKRAACDDDATVENGAESAKKTRLAAASIDERGRMKLKKVVLLLAYSGKGYLGMQRNPGCKTIEDDLMKGLYRAGAIPEYAVADPRSIWFQRAARTDKGVSAAKQSVSLRMAECISADQINAELPAQVRVLGVQRVTNKFDAKLQCNARTYIYMTPTFVFAPPECRVDESYRISEGVLSSVNAVFNMYTGTHNFHNFTSRRKPSDPSNCRFIMSMNCGAPFLRQGLEFVIVSVKGQSFMLHQIRKMIGVAMAVARGLTSEDILERAFGVERLDLPKAPGLGLVLEEVHYDRYNKRVGSGGAGTHADIDWSSAEERVTQFKQEFIFSNIASTEVEDKSMLEWMATLPLHSFDLHEDERQSTIPADQDGTESSSAAPTQDGSESSSAAHSESSSAVPAQEGSESSSAAHSESSSAAPTQEGLESSSAVPTQEGSESSSVTPAQDGSDSSSAAHSKSPSAVPALNGPLSSPSTESRRVQNGGSAEEMSEATTASRELQCRVSTTAESAAADCSAQVRTS